MSTEITRLAVGTRVARTAAPHVRGCVAGYHRSSMVVRCDDLGSHTGPAHHRTWRALTVEEAAQEAAAAQRSFAVCAVCGFTDSQHSTGCPAVSR